MNNIDQLTIDTIRVLSAEAVERAKSGHPGMPMGCAPVAYTLWRWHLKHNSQNPQWINRDRFVLSAGHGTMLLYSLLHLFGYEVNLQALKDFRQLGSITPGHPEYGHTPGVETTSGPLGQGVANAVGMALAEAYLAEKFNRDGFPVIDHFTYALAGDGCLMEGISGEASSLAGHLGLGKLILLYDSNDISIEGSTDLAFTEDVGQRYQAYGWQVLMVEDGNDLAAVSAALEEAKREKEKPSLVKVKTVIGYGSPSKQGTAAAHGEPLGEEELQGFREFLGWNHEPFTVPPEVSDYLREVQAAARTDEDTWKRLLKAYQEQYPNLYQELQQWFGSPPARAIWEDPEFWSFEGSMATRAASGFLINRLGKWMPNLVGGSADLAPSNKTLMKDRGHFSARDRNGANLHFGVREHAMAAMGSGMCRHGGLRIYVGTFLVFTDYMKAAMRLAAMMDLPVTYVLTHDSIGVGEDGPTHQPVEQLATLRSIPNLTVFRPADPTETAAGWYLTATRERGPVALALTRQKVPTLEETSTDALKGAYILRDSQGLTDAILMASGSEVQLALEAARELENKGLSMRVVSFPSFELFDQQPQSYRQTVLPPSVRTRVAVEAGSSLGWHKYVGLDGATVTLDDFGASGKAQDLFQAYEFTTDNVVQKVWNLVRNQESERA